MPRDPNSTPDRHTGGDVDPEGFVHRLLTAREVATALRVSTMTVYRMVDAGALQAVRVGRQLRIPAASFDAYIAGNSTPRRVS